MNILVLVVFNICVLYFRDFKHNRYDLSFEDINSAGLSEDDQSADSGSDMTKLDVSKHDDTPPSWVRCSPADLYFTRDTEVRGYFKLSHVHSVRFVKLMGQE